MTRSDRNEKILELKGDVWARNAADNREAYKTRGHSFRQLVGAHMRKPILALGPGPSLELVARYVGATYQPMPIITCNSALNPLAARGIVPDFICVVDAEPSIAKQIREYVDFVPEKRRRKTALVITPIVNPGVVNNWPHQIYWYASHDDTNLGSHHFFKALRAQYNDPNAANPDKREILPLSNTACVFCAVIHVAYQMAASPIFSAGFELPTEPETTYAALRYDLSVNPPKPIKETLKEVDYNIVNVHRHYAAVLLDIINSFGPGFINLSPFASFRDLVFTLPPNTLITGQFRTPPGLKVKSNGGKR